MLRSGWSRRTDDASFLNANANGPHTPGPSPDAVTFLVKERDVIGFGTECVGTDAGQAFRFDPPFPCHTFMHGANKFGLASLANLDKLPPKGAILITAAAEDRRRHRQPAARARAGPAEALMAERSLRQGSPDNSASARGRNSAARASWPSPRRCCSPASPMSPAIRARRSRT